MNVADNGDDQIQTDRGQQVIQAQNVDVWEAILAAGIGNEWMWGHMGSRTAAKRERKTLSVTSHQRLQLPLSTPGLR